MQDRTDLAFLFIGGEHQVLHLAPVAAEVSRRRPDLVVRCLCADASTAAALHAVGVAMDASAMNVKQVRAPIFANLLTGIAGRRSAAKGPLLMSIRWDVRSARAIIAPERTSAALRKFGWRRPLIHFTHGAGDRMLRSDMQLGSFDAIIVAGTKDVARYIEQGIDQSKLYVTSYVKLDYLEKFPPQEVNFFENNKKTIIYNPHFDHKISSIDISKEIIRIFQKQSKYNLIFAPHVRTFENMNCREIMRWHDLSIPGKILIDLGSSALFDTRYLRNADVYLGDGSSQLYEFIACPRPVVFLNSHGVAWQSDPHYSGWHLGEVASGAGDVLEAIDRALAGHAEKIDRQRQAIAFAFGDYSGAIDRAATLLLDILGLGGSSGNAASD